MFGFKRDDKYAPTINIGRYKDHYPTFWDYIFKTDGETCKGISDKSTNTIIHQGRWAYIKDIVIGIFKGLFSKSGRKRLHDYFIGTRLL